MNYFAGKINVSDEGKNDHQACKVLPMSTVLVGPYFSGAGEREFLCLSMKIIIQ